MSVTRRFVISVLAVGLVGSLSACSKPNPGATVWSGTQSVHSEALCWSADPSISADNCAEEIGAYVAEGGDVQSLAVSGGNTIGISVEPSVAENGWNISIGGQTMNAQPIFETYYRFTFPAVAIPEEGYELDITAAGIGNATRGVWAVRLIGD